MIPPWSIDESDSHGDARRRRYRYRLRRPTVAAPVADLAVDRDAAIASGRASGRPARPPRLMARPIKPRRGWAKVGRRPAGCRRRTDAGAAAEEMPDAMIVTLHPPDWKAGSAIGGRDAADSDADVETARSDRASRTRSQPGAARAELVLISQTPAEPTPSRARPDYGDPETADKAPERMEDEAHRWRRRRAAACSSNRRASPVAGVPGQAAFRAAYDSPPALCREHGRGSAGAGSGSPSGRAGLPCRPGRSPLFRRL
jgi:hypothetical protein